jgi:AmmeMemoRadiSam system protein B
MYIRRPAVAGSFYPGTSRKLQGMINEFLKDARSEEYEAFGIVAPHAGYVFCGKTFAKVYKSVENIYESVVILGPNHYGKNGICTCAGIWQTPLGNLKTDDEFLKELEKCEIPDDPQAHLWEHSIEVQLPWIISTLGFKSIIPISVNPIYFDVKEMKELGKILYEISQKLDKKLLVVASSDFTHYGMAYNYMPFRGSSSEILEKIKQLDMKLIKAISDVAVERVIEIGSESTACGYGCVAAMLEYAKLAGAKEAKLVDYRTSYEVSKTTDAIVAYAGIVVV